ncbi:ABC transporter ATP-binding protein [Fictibacillus phosphorivorans]|uniref:ABC transporter ATP-binding protein n=1 Tax=Fictibacillus phosphorivorans TaxID=1221500 RepID=UPI00203DFE12|nr:ABC transporter ATP-binding protein [Fictibacillus phosphorivorans]MCM3719344.1 energy-coupling factor ABC transporter ATP-binding protein [Fictibacillus phosphorivorans]MCM3776965.1 energy-coupling factor ABC transporter ATP-binding protein [Fictibacillus phosphorivorans]
MEYITSIKNLNLKFPKEEGLLFNDLSISIRKGEKVLLLGPSGCGKSTLLQVLTGLIPRSMDVPLKSESIQIPDSWGFVFQDPDSQFCMPYVDEEIAFVLENLRIPREEMTDRIKKLLTTVGLQLDNIHNKIQALSGGMKQRLALASVLALDPEVIFLDEPTALIDDDGTAQVWDTVKSIADDKTLIIVEHKIDQIIDIIDRIIVFTDDGTIMADGEPAYVFSHFKAEIKRFGIWYPNAWGEYIKEKANITYNNYSDTVLNLDNFRGYRGKVPAITLEKATVQSGEWIAVTGANGAGKSTLILSLMQLLRTTGEYKIEGRPIRSFSDLEKKTYFVFQNPEYQFLTNRVIDELTYDIRQRVSPDVMKQANDLLSLFGLKDKQNQHPYHLSLGQKRRLSVATAFLQDPKILLLDEPTFGQDSKNTFKLLELLQEESRKGTIIIMVTHDLNIIHHFATRVWEVKGGKVICDWKKDEIKREEGRMYEYTY